MNKEENKALHIGVVVCSSCNKEIKPDDDKHCFWEEDVEAGIYWCLDCHFHNEVIVSDFGF